MSTPESLPSARRGPGLDRDLRRRLDDGLQAARRNLRGLQRPDGHWRSELETDASITAETLLLCRHVGRVDATRERKMVSYLSARQHADGGWRIHPSGRYSQETTIKAYFAMKAAGVPVEDERLQRARSLVLEHGGVESAAVFTKIWLAILGQMSWRAVPCLAPEMMLLPRSAPFNIHEISYWCRAIIIPLSIVEALQTPGGLPPERGVPELFRSPEGRVRESLERGDDFISWKRLFWLADRALKGLEPMSPQLMRRRALKAAERWMLDHLEGSDGLGAIIPAMQNAVLALWMLGYPDDHPLVVKAWDDLFGLAVETEREFWLQPCLSPVWDTGLALLALQASGSEPDDDDVVAAADWLLQHRTTVRGDWALKMGADVPACAWAFQYRNDSFPDVDDTAVVVLGLGGARSTDEPLRRVAIQGGLAWLRAMQSRSGGWGAYDRNNDRMVLQHVPFADHGALLDEPAADLTGRLLTCLGRMGARRDDPVVQRAVAFLRREREPEGCWFGRWGVNFIYGTWSALEGLEAVGVPATDPIVGEAADWLESVQNPDGGWGESPDSYADRRLLARGPSTPSQTAWALLGLVAAGRADGEAARGGLAHLLQGQRPDGSWDESEWTGTGFPRVLYLRYDQYRLNFPLLALGRVREASARAG